jgi:hypothetical protein
MWHNYYTSTCLAYVGTLKKHMTARREVTKSTNYIRDKWNLCRWLTGTVRVTVVEWNFFADAVLDLLHVQRLWIWYWIMWKNKQKHVPYIITTVNQMCLHIYQHFFRTCIARFSLRRRELQQSSLRRTPRVRRSKVNNNDNDQHGQKHTNQRKHSSTCNT